MKINFHDLKDAYEEFGTPYSVRECDEPLERLLDWLSPMMVSMLLCATSYGTMDCKARAKPCGEACDGHCRWHWRQTAAGLPDRRQSRARPEIRRLAAVL